MLYLAICMLLTSGGQPLAGQIWAWWNSSSSSWTTTDWSDLWDWQQWHFECGCWRQGHRKEWHLESTSYDLVFFQRFSIVIDCHERVCEGSEWDWCGRYTAAVWSMNMYVAALGTISWRTCLTVNIEMVKCCKWTKPQRERYYIRFHFTRFLTYGNNWGEDHHYQRQGSFDGRTDREDDQGGGRIRWWGQEGEGKARWKK